MEKLQLELLEATINDIKQLVKDNPNDYDLGGKVRDYFINLPELIEQFKNNIDKI